MQTLIKHPGEVRRYTFEFASNVWAGGSRGSVFGQKVLDAENSEQFQTNVSVPLALSLVSPVATPTPNFSVTRSDGEDSDLTLTSPTVSGTAAQVTITGGTAGVAYLVSCSVQTSLGNVLTVQGNILVKAVL